MPVFVQAETKLLRLDGIANTAGMLLHMQEIPPILPEGHSEIYFRAFISNSYDCKFDYDDLCNRGVYLVSYQETGQIIEYFTYYFDGLYIFHNPQINSISLSWWDSEFWRHQLSCEDLPNIILLFDISQQIKKVIGGVLGFQGTEPMTLFVGLWAERGTMKNASQSKMARIVIRENASTQMIKSCPRYLEYMGNG